MMEKMIALQQKRRSKKGGFTLVELIVVLVILAILAALLIPALTGYINKAKEKKVIAETRMAVMAVQTMNSDYYAAKNADIDWTKLTDTQKDEFKELAEIDADTVSNVKFNDKHAVDTLTYTSDKKTCTYAKNQYTCSTLTTGK
ncbi:prepilin-type N-terminal cleavage/methylation domain-containing protein [Agathobaculum sp.]|uniref:prepilin-type N-terminal cleavage/methylation domain-containing protein n=1 Tax=Agathobaculum sp. TaxID=2048138 RepID=UPI003AB203D8